MVEPSSAWTQPARLISALQVPTLLWRFRCPLGIRAPYFGKLGRVTELPVEPVKLDTESHARIMRVQFMDGTIADIPRANVETIEQ